MLFISCSKQEPVIAWEKGLTFGEILDTAGNKYIMITIADTGRTYEPQFIASYLIKLAGAFNRVYQRKDNDGKINKIISDNTGLTKARMALVKSVQVVINEGLYLLGLQAPEEM